MRVDRSGRMVDPRAIRAEHHRVCGASVDLVGDDEEVGWGVLGLKELGHQVTQGGDEVPRRAAGALVRGHRPAGVVEGLPRGRRPAGTPRSLEGERRPRAVHRVGRDQAATAREAMMRAVGVTELCAPTDRLSGAPQA
jgi:hypothetical protein